MRCPNQCNLNVIMVTRRRTQTRFGKQLSYLRNKACLGRPELAKRAGLSPDTIQSLEQGRANNPRFRTVFALARALNVPYDTFHDALVADFENWWEPSTD